LINAANKLGVRERSHTMIVGSGLYLLRYVSTRAAGEAPIVRVKPSRTDGRGITIQPLPGRVSDDLASPGECILIRAERSGALDIAVTSATPDGSLEAEVRLERIVTSENAASERVTHAPVSASSEPDVAILAHVAHRGDCVVEQGEWIGGPDLPMAIEGLEIRWPNKPANVDLRYAAITEKSPRNRAQARAAGQFAGTRGRATPLLGLRLALGGPQSSDYELRAEALFLGASVDRKSGDEILLSGPTGREPLVGFRLSIVPTRNLPAPARPATAAEAVAMKQVGRVRVYRPASAPKTMLSEGARA
jgi:hypothetical protein